MTPFDEPGIMFSIIPNIISIVFILVLGTIIFRFFKSIRTWSYNNSQPVQSVVAKIVSKRSNVSSHFHHNNGEGLNHHAHTYTTYYVTFEVESGQRLEFNVKANEYGLLVEGDTGELTFQGTRYLGFKRNIKS